MRFMFVFVMLLVAAPLHAQEPTPAWPVQDRHVADVLSTLSVASQVGLSTWDAWRAPDRGRALMREGMRVGLTIGASEIVKRIVHRERPDGSDALSFWSEHTALAAASSGWNVSVALPLDFLTGYGRMAADKHHPSDVIVGALVGGFFARWLR